MDAQCIRLSHYSRASLTIKEPQRGAARFGEKARPSGDEGCGKVAGKYGSDEDEGAS